MNILVFDTSTEIMFVTLAQNGNITDSRTIKTTEQCYNSAFLVSTIAEITKQNNLEMTNIDAIGINIGPGSFTGLRAATTVARVMTQQLDIPAVGIPSLQIYSSLNTTKEKGFCIMDARRGKAYVAIYDKNSDPILEPCAMEYEDALNLAKSEDFFIISDERMPKILQENNIEFLNFKEIDEDFGVFLAKQTIKALEEKGTDKFNWNNLKPLYIQPPPISTPKKKGS